MTLAGLDEESQYRVLGELMNRIIAASGLLSGGYCAGLDAHLHIRVRLLATGVKLNTRSPLPGINTRLRR